MIVNNKDLYRLVSLIRHAELKIVEVYPTDIMQTPVHLSIGQEEAKFTRNALVEFLEDNV
jgi:TPP-dependent pyruvate/acetoin dehydrogenase alpha subunit